VARAPAPHFESILEFIVWGTVFNQLATAYLFSRHLRASRIAALGILTAAYICTALLTLGYIVAFPSQAAVVLGISWHYVFPLTVIAYVLSRRRSGTISADAAATLSIRIPLIAAILTLLAVAAVLYKSGDAHAPSRRRLLAHHYLRRRSACSAHDPGSAHHSVAPHPGQYHDAPLARRLARCAAS